MTTLERTLPFTDSSGHQISGILAKPAGGTDRLAVLCHGFLSNKNSATNRALTAMLLPQGIATLRFDFFGHGDSEGPFEKLTVGIAVQQTLAALGLAGSRGYRKIGLAGSSFGGLVALLAAGQLGTPIKISSADARSTETDIQPQTATISPARHYTLPPPVGQDRPFSRGKRRDASSSLGLTCLALKCPVSDLATMLRDEFGTTEMRQWQRTNTIPNITGKPGRIPLLFSFYEDCAHHVAYEAPKAMTLPTLIVHGGADEYVPVAQSLRLQEFLGGNTSLVVLAGADHHFSQPAHFREMTDHMGRWIADHLN
jgi:pimeloyl-ACP methyl ester carboxylesterase